MDRRSLSGYVNARWETVGVAGGSREMMISPCPEVELDLGKGEEFILYDRPHHGAMNDG